MVVKFGMGIYSLSQREVASVEERDREMEMERIIFGKRKWDGSTHVISKVILH